MSKLLALIASAAPALLSLSVAHAGATLDHIRDAHEITLGYREASIPFSYLDAQQKPVGFSMDLCSHIVDHLKTEPGMSDLRVKQVPVNSSNRIPLIRSGVIDIECGGTSSSKKRLEQVAFSVSTFASRPSWLAMTASGLHMPQDLKGQTVVVTQGSNAVGIAKNISREDKLDLNIIQGKDHAESFLLLTTGRAKAFMEDDILLAGLAAQSADPKSITFLQSNYPVTWYGLMFSRDDPEFKALVDGVLSQMMASGQFIEIYDKWFTQPIPPKNVNLGFPLSEALKERVAHPSDVVDY